MITLKRKLLFSAITFVLFMALLVLSEFILRFLFPEMNNPLASEITADGIESYQINRSYLKKYFPNNAAVLPELKPTIFRKYKLSNTYRVICIGSSSMLGTPYQLTTNIPSIVRKQLRHLYPEKEIEVINLGAAAINSNVMLDLSKKAVGFDPDLILIYMGHNEFYGPEGIGASLILKHFPSTIPLKYSLQDLWLVKIFETMLSPEKKPSAEHNLMKQVSQNSGIHLSSPQADRIFSLFESNASQMLDLFHDRHIPVIMSDLSSNLLFPPFQYDTSDVLKNHLSEFGEVRQAFEKNDYTGISSLVTKLLGLDSANALLNYAAGKVMASMDSAVSARKFFIRAKDEDLLKFRAPSQINSIIRKVAAEHNVLFISSDSMMSALSPHGIPGQNLFLEHLHPNPAGYYEIATLFTRAIVDHHSISTRSYPPTALLPFQYDTLGIPWLDLAYGDLSMKRLTSQWPFDRYHALTYATPAADDILQQIVLQVYEGKLSLTEGCYQSGTRFQRLHRFNEALTSFEAISDDFPYNYYPYYLSGSLCKDFGMNDRALGYYVLSIQCNSEYIFSHIDIALLKINVGQFDEAIVHLQKAKDLTLHQSTSPLVTATIYYGLSAAYANKNNIPQAVAYITESLHYDPDYAAAQDLARELKNFTKK